MTLLVDVGVRLDTATIVTADLTLGTNLFLGREPADPDTCVTLYETAGAAPVDFFGDDTTPTLENPGLQVRVRAAGYATARALAGDVWENLAKVTNDTLSGTLYQRIAPVQSPTPLMRDDRDRIVFVANFDVVKNA